MVLSTAVRILAVILRQNRMCLIVSRHKRLLQVVRVRVLAAVWQLRSYLNVLQHKGLFQVKSHLQVMNQKACEEDLPCTEGGGYIVINEDGEMICYTCC